MTTAQQAVVYAKSFVGNGPSQFCGAFGASNSTPWCAMFASYVLRNSGLTGTPWTMDVGEIWRWGLNEGRCTSEPRQGDLAIINPYRWNNNKPFRHVTILDSLEGSRWRTVGGNESGQVRSQLRTASWIRSEVYGFVRPPYSDARPHPSEPTPEPTIEEENVMYIIKKADGSCWRVGSGLVMPVTSADLYNRLTQVIGLKAITVYDGEFDYEVKSAGGIGWI